MRRTLLATIICLLLVGVVAPSAAAAQPDERTVEDVLSGVPHLGPAVRTPAPAVAPEATGAAAAAAAVFPSDCPVPVTSSTRLTQDLSCRLVVQGDDITIDLDGHEVAGVYLEFGDHLVIRDGTITGNVYLDSGSDNVLDGVTVRGVGGFAVTLGCGDLVLNSRFIDNDVALDQYFCGGVEIRNSTFVGNAVGVNIASNEGDLVNGNRFEDNGVGVFIWDEDEFGANGALVKRNTFERNTIGLSLITRGEAFGNRIVRNEFLRNTSSGIRVELTCFSDAGCATGTRIEANRLIGNGRQPLSLEWWNEDIFGPVPYVADDGITVVGREAFLDRVTLARNVAVLNADHGIDADGVTDGRGNRARKNGSDPQCVGVVCRR